MPAQGSGSGVPRVGEAEIRIYQAEDGKRLGAVREEDPPTSYGSFALSPDGSQLAALSGSKIEVFALAN